MNEKKLLKDFIKSEKKALRGWLNWINLSIFVVKHIHKF
jgi:hypothetical protein